MSALSVCLWLASCGKHMHEGEAIHHPRSILSERTANEITVLPER